jgi:hypothetical protein
MGRRWSEAIQHIELVTSTSLIRGTLKESEDSNDHANPARCHLPAGLDGSRLVLMR